MGQKYKKTKVRGQFVVQKLFTITQKDDMFNHSTVYTRKSRSVHGSYGQIKTLTLYSELNINPNQTLTLTLLW